MTTRSYPLFPVPRLSARALWAPICLLSPSVASASATPDLTFTAFGFVAIAIFVLAYALVVTEEVTGLRKSKPLVVAAGLIWLIVAIAWKQRGVPGLADALRHNLLEYAELLLFLLAAMSYVNTMEERRVFERLRAGLIARRLSFAAHSG